MKIRMQAGDIQLRIATGSLLLAGLLLGHAALGQTREATRRAAAKPALEQDAQSPAPQKPGGEGIKVHGHWVLQVKNPDGTLGERREFENSLVTSGSNGFLGSTLLVNLLGGVYSSGGLGIALITGPATTAGIDASTFCGPPAGSDQPSPAQPVAPAGISCYGFVTSFNSVAESGIITSINSIGPPQVGLNVSLGSSLVLSGNYTVPSGMGTITAVQSYLGVCSTTVSGVPITNPLGSGIAPNQCNNSSVLPTGKAPAGSYGIAGPLTSTTISPLPLSVTAGQIIAITFTLSFS
jgi:hypothetical protein